MERRINFTLIGIIFFSILTALVVFIITLGRYNFDDKDYFFYNIYTDHDITGLSINTPVRYKGINIGSISHIGFDDKQIGMVKIIVKIKKHIPVKKGSTLSVDSQGLAGLNFLSLKQSNQEEVIKNKKDAILNFEPNIFGKLTLKADEASKEVLILLKSFKTLLSQNNISRISHIIDSVQNLSQNLNQTQDHIDKLAQNLNTLTDTLNHQLSNGDYNAREILSPLILRIDHSLNYIDQFFKLGSDVLNKFEKDPYNTLFGEQKR
ncbi:MlaD family protein [Helicobacter anatolicus]|uniref:MlaD family protein n=1 Tax=Helicobacter anatolicus TaxID=2905874 RepID=UPI001E41731B|nr:MlaD family protein [Helicobacter anatolicus]MCE3038733.1 MlaD family protein [Helicobacter anatolicus]